MSFIADGRRCTAPEGATILEACRAAGIAIPTLCHLDGVSPAGSCRLCLVEVSGFPRPVAACATPVLEGVEVVTTSDALLRHRRMVVELLFASGNHVCAFCPANGACELQELARALGLDCVTLGVPRRAPPIDASHPRFALDPGRCVLCSRCVRVCAEVEGAGSLGIGGRGRGAHVITDGLAAWASSPTCTACGKCVEACPTGAMFDKDRAAQGLPRPSRERAAPRRARLATVQLGGCAGCHMSLLDGDERLMALAGAADLVFSPLADAGEFPRGVDLCIVEGAVATDHDLALVRRARERSRRLVALGDCAGWGNVTAARDAIGGAERVLSVVRGDAARDPALPRLLDRVLPVGEVVAVDAVLPGCPPRADLILFAVSELIAGRAPDLRGAGRFG